MSVSPLDTAGARTALSFALALALLGAGCATTKPCNCPCAKTGANAVANKKSKAGAGATTSKVKVQLYVMSKCPFAKEAEAGLQRAVRQLGADRVALRLDYIVRRDDAGKFTAMHGPTEVAGNIQQLCAQHIAGPKLLAFVACQNDDFKNIPGNGARCAKAAGIDAKRFATCSGGTEGRSLLAASMKRAAAANADASPTIMLGGKAYRGGYGSRDFLRAVCGHYSGAKPKICSAIPAPVQVNAIVLTDKRCKKCAVNNLLANLRGRFFSKLKTRTVDYNTPEGKKLFKSTGVDRLPALLFDNSVTKADKFAMLKRWMAKKGDYYSLAIPATFDPTAEICDNKKDDTGNGKVDCADATCKQALVCRKVRKRRADVFVMSQCPFGAQAVLAVDEVLKNFKGKVKFDIHFIADDDGKGGFASLHGPSEVAENIRQLCAKKHYARKNRYLAYLTCRAKSYRSNDWKPCAKGAIKAKVIERCAKKHGKALLAADIKIAKALNIGGSPTWMANNRFLFSAITAEKIKQGLCKHNPKLKGCKNKLSDKSSLPTGGSCGGSP